MSGTDVIFSVYGTEFCRALEAVGLFQAKPKDFAVYAAVRGFVRYDGLTMTALNTRTAAVTTISTLNQQGSGLFSLPFDQVRVVLAMFKRRLPKDVPDDEYVLEVAVMAREIRIRETSDVFDHTEWVYSLPDPRELATHETSDDEHAMSTASAMNGILAHVRPAVLDGGYAAQGPQLALLARAARILDAPLMLRTTGRALIATIGTDFTTDLVVVTTLGHDDAVDPRAAWDSRTLTEYQQRLDDLVTQGGL